MPPVFTRVAGGKTQHLERQNRKDAGHGVEDHAPQKGKPNRQHQGHVRRVGGGGRGSCGRGCSCNERCRASLCRAHGTRRYIDIEIFGLGWIAQPRISAALIGDGKRQLLRVVGERNGEVGFVVVHRYLAKEFIGFVYGGRERDVQRLTWRRCFTSYPERMLIEVVALCNLPVQTELALRGDSTVEPIGLPDGQKLTLLLQRGGQTVLCVAMWAAKQKEAHQREQGKAAQCKLANDCGLGVLAGHDQSALGVTQTGAVVERQADFVGAEFSGKIDP